MYITQLKSKKGRPFETAFLFYWSVLFHRIHDRFERLRIVHREVSECFTVDVDLLYRQLVDELRVAQAVLAHTYIDTLYPQSAHLTFLRFAVAVSIGLTFFPNVLGDGQYILALSPETPGSF